MTSRRAFLQIGLAATALPVVARAEQLIATAAVELVPLYKVLYDTRFPASVAFARRAAAGGAAVQSMAGDMTSFWYGDLYHRWREGPAAIAGLTAHGALFCLERLAWDHCMRVVFRGEHSPGPEGAVSHRFEGPESLLQAAVCAIGDGEAWASELANVVAQCPRARGAQGSVSALTAHAPLPPSSSEPLFSWVIAKRVA